MNTHAAPRKDQSFTFRPAKLRRPQTWTFKADRLTGPGGTVALPSVQRAALMQMRSGGTRLMRFDLETANQIARIQISTTSRRLDADPDLAEFLALLSAVAHRLGHVRPGMSYQMEDTGRAPLALFMIGAAMALVGLLLTALAGFAFLDALTRFYTILPALLLMILAGVVIACRFWPFSRPDEYPIASLPFVLWTMGGPRPEGVPEGQIATDPLGGLR